MKIGILCEGEMTDEPVLKLLLESLFPEIEFIIRGVSKAIIFKAADVELGRMFQRDVKRFLVVWDLLPPGHGMDVESQRSKKAKRVEQRKQLLELLCDSERLPKLLSQQVKHFAYRYQFNEAEEPHPNGDEDVLKLVCVCYAMDGWLLSDTKLLCELLSTKAHQLRCLEPKPGLPDECPYPDQLLRKCCVNSPNKRFRYYNKTEHNEVIAREYIRRGSIEKMRVSQSFCRVVDNIERWSRNEG